ncbi:hypothetical protein B9Z55_021028 [Caenorhabditis nigoni]|uniref:7TM GPCR serpentine receptor class x (Srx) domain-containing protein n=1 Tax=Caenorhabditis nigoni TaxID=1611254 RepID=A0A2G5TQB2_9PELO|nr:hypothetical protein B9Z55_021028 [Caenorhabditis nigoni]
MSDKVIQSKSPKLGFIPARPFLVFISFLELLWTLSYLTTEPPSAFDVIICTLGAAFNVCLIYGTLKINDKALGYSQIYVISLMIVSFVMLCFGPVLFSSFIASDYHKYHKLSESSNDEIKKQQTDIYGEIIRAIPEQNSKEAAGRKFLTGIIAGEMVVFFHIVCILYFYVEYVMIKRLRKFIAARKETYGKEFLA